VKAQRESACAGERRKRFTDHTTPRGPAFFARDAPSCTHSPCRAGTTTIVDPLPNIQTYNEFEFVSM
jgi:hypothetical protein